MRFLLLFFSLSDSDSDDELDEFELDDDEAELDSFDGDRFFVVFSLTGDATGRFVEALLFCGNGDGVRRLATGGASVLAERFAGETRFSSSDDEGDGLTLIRFVRFFSRESSGDGFDFFCGALTGDGDGDGERDDDELDDEARAFPFGSTGFFFLSTDDDDDDEDVDDDEGERFFTGSIRFGLIGLRRFSGVGERRRFDVDAFDLS